MSEWWANLMPGLRKRRAATPSPFASGGDGRADHDVVAASERGDETADPSAALLAWLLQTKASDQAELTGAETRGIEHLATLLRGSRSAAELLPRAPAVIPQLLSMLRNDGGSLAAISQRVAADVVLSAEVLRQARSAAYVHRRETADQAIDLSQALALLGADGLKAVIARVVLRPLFDGQAGRLSGAASARVWRYAESQAQHAAAQAAQRGLDPFDGYLGGLVHSSGWTVALRALDRLDTPLALPFSHAFVQRLLPLKDALFGKVVADWRLTPKLTALCRELRQGAPMNGLPLGAALLRAQQQAAIEMLQGDIAAAP